MQSKKQLRKFAEWVAKEVTSENFEYNAGGFAEIACRKLFYLGIVTTDGENWQYEWEEDT